MGKPRSLTPVPGRSRQRDDNRPRADPIPKQNDTEQFDAYGNTQLQQSLTNPNNLRSNTIVRTQETPSRWPHPKQNAFPPHGHKAKRATSDRRGRSLENHHRRIGSTNDRPEVFADSGHRYTDGSDQHHNLNRQRSLDNFNYQDMYPAQADESHTRHPEPIDPYGRPQPKDRNGLVDDRYDGRSESTRGRRRSDSTHRGRNRGSDRHESRRRSSSRRLMRNRKRDKNSRQVSTRKISEDHVTIFYIEDGPEIEICSEEITRGMYGSKKAIYFLFRVTVPNAEKIKKDLQLKFDFCADWWDEDHSWEEADKRKEKVPVLRVSPQSIRTSVNPVDRAESYGLEGGVDANGGRFGALWNDAKAWTELGFWELKGEQKSYDITASLKKHGHKAPLMPVPFNLQFVIQDDDQTRFFIACDVDWTRKGIRISDDGWTGHWREVDMTGRNTEEKNIRSWADEKWEAKGNPIGFEKTTGKWMAANV